MFKLISFLLSALLITSCVLPRNNVYLKHVNKNSDTILLNSYEGYLLKEGDNLSIGMKSLDSKSDFIFLKNTEGYSEAYHYINSYSISEDGHINLPVIGRMQVSGKSVDEVAKIISDSLSLHFTDPTVYVKLSEFRITVLGEVKRPGTYHVYHSKISLMNALGYAGDITDRGNMKVVQVIRKTDGKTVIRTFDLTKMHSLEDSGFVIHPNDIIYVRPVLFKYIEENTGPVRLVLASFTAFFAILRFTRN